MDGFVAMNEASTAYRDAMPALVGEDGIRDFLACTAQGILIIAIPRNQASQLIYAALVALNLLHLQGKQPHQPVAAPSKPAPRELPPPPSLEDRIEIGARERANRFK